MACPTVFPALLDKPAVAPDASTEHGRGTSCESSRKDAQNGMFWQGQLAFGRAIIPQAFKKNPKSLVNFADYSDSVE